MYHGGTVTPVKVSYQDHEGKELTGREMYRLAEIYSSDLGEFAAWPFSAFFDYVRCIPYLSDEDRFPSRMVEVLSRPKYLLDRSIFPRIDCKKKAILIACWAKCKNISYRFVAVGELGGPVSHVFCQVKESGTWCTMDCTIPGLYTPGAPMPTVTSAFEI